MVTFDDILNSTLKMGFFQKRTLAVVSMIDFSDGIEKTIVGLLLTILKKEWNLSNNQVSNLASIYFIGIVSGTLFCSFNADRFGRQRTLFISSLIGFICMMWMSLAQNYLEMFLVRLGFGFIFGTTIPLGHVVISEIVPANIRGSIMTLVATIFIIGKVYCTFLCMLLLTGFDSGHWRILTLLNSIPLLLCCMGSYLVLRESPRYLMMRNQFDQAFVEIELIALTNNHQEFKLSNLEKQGLIDTQLKLNHKETNIFELFRSTYSAFTIRMWIVFILTSVLETSIYILMPFWLHASSKGFIQMMYMMMSELIANLCVVNVIDSKSIGGRQRLVIILSILIGLLSFCVFLIGDSLLVFGLSGISFLLKMMFTTEMVIMNENYSTQYRSMGVGLTQTMGKLTGAWIPFIIFPIYYYNPYLPFLIYGFCMIFLAYFAYQFPFDMTQVELDSVKVFGNSNQNLTQISEPLI